MILGIGTDIVETSRVARAICNPRFLEKCYTATEIDRCNSHTATARQKFAGYFAAKEAIAKALGTGFRGFLPRDIEICHDSQGKPTVRLSENISIPKKCTILISISHEEQFATAFAVIQGGDADASKYT